MRVAIASALVFVACTSLFIACTDDPSSGVTPDTDAGDLEQEVGSNDKDKDTDQDDKRSPSGCLLTTTGFKIGAKAENVARDDVPNAVSWNDVENALTDDGAFATVTLAEGEESATLRVSDFNLAIPETGETWGIEVELKRRAPDGGVEDARIDVEIEGKPSRFKYVVSPWPMSIVGTHAYGQAVDTWGVDLYPSDVNNRSFAAKLSVKRTEGVTGPVTALVDSLKVAVHYCPDPI